MNPSVRCVDLGLIDYKKAWDLQEELLQEIVQKKLLRKEHPEETLPSGTILTCEHPHVFTLGKSGDESHLLLDKEGLSKEDASFYRINRGGDITYHGPGQLVVYPILDLEQFFRDIHKYMRLLEEAVILTLADFGIDAGRVEGLTGVWIDENGMNPRKICAMGVKSSRWVTMHGIGFNVNTELAYFQHIVPCGISDKSVTSMQQELGKSLDMDEVKNTLLSNLQHVFQFDWVA
jgi:lipoyl(octanoyl) transferase